MTTVHNLHKTKRDLNNPEHVFIGRPGPLGNPFVLNNPDDDTERARVIRDFEQWARKEIATNPAYRDRVAQLRGKQLFCYCAPKPCHGDVLARLADELAAGTGPAAAHAPKEASVETGTTLTAQQLVQQEIRAVHKRFGAPSQISQEQAGLAAAYIKDRMASAEVQVWFRTLPEYRKNDLRNMYKAYANRASAIDTAKPAAPKPVASKPEDDFAIREELADPDYALAWFADLIGSKYGEAAANTDEENTEALNAIVADFNAEPRLALLPAEHLEAVVILLRYFASHSDTAVFSCTLAGKAYVIRAFR